MKNDRKHSPQSKSQWILSRMRHDPSLSKNITFTTSWESPANDGEKSVGRSNYSTASSFANKMKSSLYSNRRKHRQSMNSHSFNSHVAQNNLMKQLKEFEDEKENITIESKSKVSTGITENIQSKYTKKRKKPGCCSFDSNKTFDTSIANKEINSNIRPSNSIEKNRLTLSKYESNRVKSEINNLKSIKLKEKIFDYNGFKMPFKYYNQPCTSRNSYNKRKEINKSKTQILAPPCTCTKSKNENSPDIPDINFDMFSSDDFEYNEHDWQYHEATEERLGTVSEFADYDSHVVEQTSKIVKYCNETRFINSMKNNSPNTFSSRRQSFLKNFISNVIDSNIIIRNGREVLKDVSNKRIDFCPNSAVNCLKPVQQIILREETVNPETMLTTEQNCDLLGEEEVVNKRNQQNQNLYFKKSVIKRAKNTEYLKPKLGDTDASNNQSSSKYELQKEFTIRNNNDNK